MYTHNKKILKEELGIDVGAFVPHHFMAMLRRYFKLLRSPGIDSKDSIPPAYVAWRAGATTLFLLGS
jgi:hypothetical protein